MSLLASTFTTLVNKYGTPCTLSKNTYGTYSPATGTLTSTTTSNFTVNAYFANYNLSEIDNDSVVNGDRRVILNAKTTVGVSLPEPKPDDTIAGQGDTVKIVAVQKILDKAVVTGYICQVRE